MEKLLTVTCAPAIWIIALAELALLIVMLRDFSKSKRFITLFTALITAGLFIDAFIIALGTIFNAESLRGISRLRFLSHGALIPLLFIICSLALECKKPVSYIFYAITGILVILGIAEACATVLGPVEIAGVSRMASVKGETPKWAEIISRLLSFGTIFPLIATGIYCRIKDKTFFLFLAGFFMFAFSALGPATGNSQFIFYISMFGELLMITFLYLYSKKVNK